VDYRVYNITQECSEYAGLIDEDTSDYCAAWEELNNLTTNQPSCQWREFQYTAASDLDGSVFSGQLDSYGGGGYVYRLSSSSAQIQSDLVRLQQQHWINNQTRAIFLEFAVYNPNVSRKSLIVSQRKRLTIAMVSVLGTMYTCRVRRV
jgi:hypothetical protein